MNHRGSDTNSASSAASVAPADQPSEAHQRPPCSSVSAGKRRWATSLTMAGVIIVATTSRQATTTTGTLTITSSSGASTALNPVAPSPSSQPRKVWLSDHVSSHTRTCATASLQPHQARPPRHSMDSTSGSTDSQITRGCRQYSMARQAASTTDAGASAAGWTEDGDDVGLEAF